MTTGWIWAAIGAVVLVMLYLWYATIVRRANQRHDLIPNLVKLAGRFMEHERGLIEEVTRLRSQAQAAGVDTAARFAAKNRLAQATGRLLVTRERGLLGKLIASFGSGIERVALEDPVFERRFEVYGTDQVWCRTVLTTTMLERLVRLDEVAHAHSFRCAFVGRRLLVALAGMHWRAPLSRLVVSIERRLAGYRQWLAELVALPAAIVGELALAASLSPLRFRMA